MTTKTNTKRDYIWITPTKKPPVKLTERQQQIIDLLCKGHRTKEIAYRLDLSEVRISQHLAAIRKKLDAKTNVQAVNLMCKQ